MNFYYDNDRAIDLICMGRVAVDLYSEQVGSDLKDATSFKKYLGGCAGNIAVGCARLGLKTMMFSCVGQDEMGLFLKEELQREGVNINLLYDSPAHLTGLVLLGIKPPHHFPLMFYRKDCADMQLKDSQIKDTDLAQAKALLITGTGLSTPEMHQTTLNILAKARAAETTVILDLDFRPVLWGLTALGNGELRYSQNARVTQEYQKVLAFCDLIVGTEEELCIAGGFDDLQASLNVIQTLTKAPVIIKRGAQGASLCFADLKEKIESKPFPVQVLNVLGAGDGFMSGLLSGLLQGKNWETSLAYGNASGALVVTRHGCAPAIPYKEELEFFIQNYERDPMVWKHEKLAQLHAKENHSLSSSCLIKNPSGFEEGINRIVTMDQKYNNSGMSFSSLILNKEMQYHFKAEYEYAVLLMIGRVEFHYAGIKRQVERRDYFSQNPFVLHCCAGELASLVALTDCELLIMETANTLTFKPMLFDESNMLECDNRGKNILEDSSYRIVRTVFDKRNRPESNLVVGEIITFQGRWSSYPSHYHDQPEIYHYRFSEPQGYAFGEQGKEVLRIEHYDTYQITQAQEHAHCTAPGYALYTLWFIRHLEDNPYHVPIFRKEHEWCRTAKANQRVWTQKQGS